MTSELAAFITDHPRLEQVDLLLPDINGLFRGKKVSAAGIKKCFEDGILLPRSVYGLDITGATVEATNLGIATGDQDYVCRPEAATLREIPWLEPAGAQAMMEMYEPDGTPYPASPRQALRELVAALGQRDLFATVAVELEFYLFDARLDERGYPQILLDPISGEPNQSTQVYSIDDLDNFRPFIQTVQRYCAAQQVPASAAIAEYAPGQFEINLAHKNDPVAACDDAMYLKRIIKLAAREHGMCASFMAKPLAGQTGSGMHIHVSICDREGNNRFAKNPRELEHAVAGLQKTMTDAMLLFAPHANSFRRFQKGAYVPLSPTWGHNNRTVALRVPAGPEHARRIEHRVAGADANPYLVMAAVLAGVLEGYEDGLEPDAPMSGDAAEQCDPELPCDWRLAIDKLAESGWARSRLGNELVDTLTTIKYGEYQAFQRAIPPLDIQWYFQVV